MGTSIEPIVYKINDDEYGIKEFHDNLLKSNSEKLKCIMLKFPTVYIHNWKDTWICVNKVDTKSLTFVFYHQAAS